MSQIIKIGQCWLKLRLKMPGMIFETLCRINHKQTLLMLTHFFDGFACSCVFRGFAFVFALSFSFLRGLRYTTS